MPPRGRFLNDPYEYPDDGLGRILEYPSEDVAVDEAGLGRILEDPSADDVAPAPDATDQDFRSLFRETLAEDEGRVDEIYPDRGGRAFGYGHFIKPGDPEYGLPEGTAISPERVEQAFDADMNIALDDARKVFPNFDTLPRNVRIATASMAYQMGRGDLADFVDYKAAVDKGDWQTAAAEMRDSLWAQQTPERVERLATLVETQEPPAPVSRTRRRGRPIPRAPEGPDEDGPMALSRGWVSGLLKENPTLTAETLEGLSYLAPEAFRETLAGYADELRELAKGSPEEYERRARGLWETRNLDDFLTWAGETVGQGLASSVPSVITGVIGGAVGQRIARRPGAVVGSIAGSTVPSATLNYGDVYTALKEEGVEPERAANWALAATPAMAALDVASLGPIVNRLGGMQKVRREMARKIARRVAVEGAKGATREGITEAAQEAVKLGTVSLETGKPFFTIETAKQTLESGLGGALTGAPMGSASGVMPDRVNEIAAAPSRSEMGERARAMNEVSTPTPEDEASPINTEDIVEGRRVVADAQAKADANAWLRGMDLPVTDSPVRIVTPENVAVEGVVKDAWRDGNPGISVEAVDGTILDLTFLELERSGSRVEALAIPDVETVTAQRADEYTTTPREITPETRLQDLPPLSTAQALEVSDLVLRGATLDQAYARVLEPEDISQRAEIKEIDDKLTRLGDITVEPTPVGPDTVAREIDPPPLGRILEDPFGETVAQEIPGGRVEAVPIEPTRAREVEGTQRAPQETPLEEVGRQVRAGDLVPTEITPEQTAREVEPEGLGRILEDPFDTAPREIEPEPTAREVIVRKDGRPFPTEGMARITARAQKVDAVTVEVPGGWGYRELSPREAETVEARPVGAPQAAREALPPTGTVIARPGVARDGERAAQPAPVETEPSGAPQPAAPPVETASPTAPDGAVPLAEGIYGFKPETLETDARAFQYKEGGDEAGVTERLQGVKRWDPDKSGVALVYERADGTRVVADGHQRLGLAKRLAAEGQDPRIIGRLYREADGWTVEDIREKAALKNIAEGTGTAFDAATVLRDSKDPEAALAELPPQSNLVRVARDISRMEEEPFRMAKAAGLPDSHVAAIGRVAEGDGPLQEALVKEFADQKPANVGEAESLARLFKEDRAENVAVADLFGENEIATSRYRERARIISMTINRLKQDKRVFATLGRHAEQIEAAGNVLTDENVEIAEEAGQAALLVQQLATRAGPVSDAVKAAAGRAHETGNYKGAVSEVVAAVKEWVDVEGGALGIRRRGAGTPVAEGRDVEAVPPGRAPETGRIDEDPDLDIEAIPTAAELEAEGQELMFRRTGELPPGWNMHRTSAGKFVADSASRRTKPFDTEEEAIAAAHKAAGVSTRLSDARAQAKAEGLTGQAAFRRVAQIMEEGEGRAARPADERINIQVTSRFDEKRSRVFSGLRRVARETFGEGFNINLAEEITGPRGERVAGAYDPNIRVAYIALRSTEEGMQNTLWHEGLHHLRRAGAFSKADGTPTAAWRALEKEAPRWREQYGIDERYGPEIANLDDARTQDLLNEEAISEALGAYAANRDTQLSPTVRMAFDRILKFFRAVARVLKGQGFHTWQDVFEGDIATGRAGRRADARRSPSRVAMDRYLQTAWHGSVYEFDAFSTEAIGTGEGAQAFGWGVYFSSSRDIAEWYRRTVSAERVKLYGETVENPTTMQAAQELAAAKQQGPEAFEDARESWSASLSQSISLAERRGRTGGTVNAEWIAEMREAARDIGSATPEDVETPRGATYRVDLAPQDDEYLRWDEPFERQSEKVKSGLRKLWEDRGGQATGRPPWVSHDGATGEAIYAAVATSFGSPKDGSLALLDAGVRGVKYRDATTRGQEGEGTFNFVIFDERDISVEEIMLQRERLGLFDTEETDQGEQAVIPGAERITDRQLAERRMAEPLRAARTQRPMDEGLFGEPDTQIDLEEVIEAGQGTLLQRFPTAEEPDAFDKAATDELGVDMTGAAAAVNRDKEQMEGLAENIESSLKGTSALQEPASVIEEDGKTRLEDLSPLLRFAAPSLEWSKKFPEINKLVQRGVLSEKQASMFIQRLARDWDGVTRRLSRPEYAELTGVLFESDVQERAFTNEELEAAGVSQKVRTAYRNSRLLDDKINRYVTQGNRSMAIQRDLRRAALVKDMAGARGMDAKAFRKLYDDRAALIARLKDGKANPDETARRIEEATEDLFGQADAPSQEFQEWLAEADLIERHRARSKTRMEGAKTPAPHRLFGRWRIFREAREGEQGDLTLDRNGRPFARRSQAERAAKSIGTGEAVEVEGGWAVRGAWSNVAGEHGFWETRTDAVKAAAKMMRDDPDGNFKVSPVEFMFPDDLDDGSYWRFKGTAEQAFGLEGQELKKATRFAGVPRPFKRNESAEAFGRDLDRIKRAHIAHAVRGVVLGRLKYDVQDTMRKEGLGPGSDRPMLTAALDQWRKDLTGEKQQLETWIDNWFDKPYVTPLRAGLAAGAAGFLASGNVANPLSPLIGAYVGYRVGMGLHRNPTMATRSITGAMLGDMAHLKLGAFFNVMSALVNTTQLVLNTYPVMGARDTAVGIKRFNAAVLSKMRGKPNADYRFLERLDIHPLDTMAEGTRHAFRKESRLSKMSMVFFTGAEHFNRGSSALAALNKAQREGWSHTRAKQYANEVMDRTQFHYGQSDKPEILRNVLARLPLQFKNFVSHQIAFTFGIVKAGVTQKGERAALLRFLMAMALTAGTLGLPGLDAIDALMDWLFGYSPIAGMKQTALEQAAKGELEGGMATLLSRGIPGLAGIDMTGRVGMGDRFLPMQLRDWKGPWLSTLENAVRHGRENAAWQHQVRNLSPGLGNPLVVLDAWQNGGVLRSAWKRNRPEYTMTNTEMIQKLVGARPYREAQLQDLRDVESRIVERRRTDTRRFVDRIIAAQMRGDSLEVARLYDEAFERGVLLRPHTIQTAMRAMMEERSMRSLRLLPKELRPEGMRLRAAIGG